MTAIRSEVRDMNGWPPDLQNYVIDIRSKLNAGENQRLYDDYGKKKIGFDRVFMFNYWMQTEFERYGKKRMKLMPIFGVHRAHIRLDVRSLLYLFKRICPKDKGFECLKSMQKLEARDPKLYMLDDVKKTRPKSIKQKDCADDKEWEDHQTELTDYDERVQAIMVSPEYVAQKNKSDTYFKAERDIISSFFKKSILSKKKHWDFDGSVATDGVSISLQYSKSFRILVNKKGKKRKKPSLENEVNKDLDYDRELPTRFGDADQKQTIVLGIDPGRTNLACVSYFLSESEKKTWSLTRGCYYAESGIKKLNIQKRNRYKEFFEKWKTLGGEECGLSTSRPSNILTYLKRYSLFSGAWWEKALAKKESIENLQRYAGKRHVMDSFYSKIKKQVAEKFPEMNVCVAYGSTVTSMKATGPGEIAAPVDAMYASCRRIFKDQVVVVDEFRSTMMSWKHATKKENVYKQIALAPEESEHMWKEHLCHTQKRAPIVTDQDDVDLINFYNSRKAVQNKHRRGGTSTESDVLKGIGDDAKRKKRKVRFPEVRGLRFSKEDGMYLDRDREAALTIARLCCMEKMALPRPYPFDRRYVIES